MHVRNQFNPLIGGLCLLVALGGPLYGGNKKGDKLEAEGYKAEQQNDYDTALELYEKALSEDPSDSGYMMSVRRVRFQAAQRHLEEGQRLRNQGDLEAALASFQRAFAMDPSSILAEQEIQRTYAMIERERKKAAQPGATPSTAEERALTPAEQARAEAEKRTSRILPPPVLKPISPQVNLLKMNNQPPKVLFETLGKLAGINVVFDPEYVSQPGKNFSVDLTNTTLEEALDYLAVLTKSYWKPLSANTIFVTMDNVTKRRDYEDFVVKVFYLQNTTSQQELNEISTTVRSITDIRRVFVYNGQNAIIVRGETDKVALAEKLIQDLDKPKAEVVVDVIVMEANRARTRDLAATITSGGVPGINIGISPAVGGLTGTPDGEDTDTGGSGGALNAVTLGRLGKLNENDFAVTLPGAVLTAMLSDRGTRVLQSPQLRAVDNQKASLRIGDRVPTATGSFQPGIGTVGISPLVNTQFQFIDVGVNVDMVPKVQGNDVSLHIEMDVSNVRDRVDIGGIEQPVIGQRKIIHDVRIRNGEISLLGGLMQEQETTVVSGVPGLADIPVLGRLFKSEKIEKSRGELLIALVPHIVRTADITPANMQGVATGTDQGVKLNYAPRKEEKTPTETAPAAAPAGSEPAASPAPAAPKPPAAQPAPATPQPAQPAAPKPAPAQNPAAPPVGIPIPGLPPGVLPGGARPSPAGPAVESPAAAPSPENPPANPADPPSYGGPGTAKLSLTPAATTVAPNGSFTVTMQVDNVNDLFSAPMRMRFDPKLLRLDEVTRGNLLAGDGQNIIFTRNIQNDTGEVSINLNRLPGSAGVSGSGTLVTFRFTALGSGAAKIEAPEVNLKNSQLQAIPAEAPQVTITVK